MLFFFYRFAVHVNTLKVKRKSTVKMKQNKNLFSLFEVNICQTNFTRETLYNIIPINIQ